jgi:hypothetical protein
MGALPPKRHLLKRAEHPTELAATEKTSVVNSMAFEFEIWFGFKKHLLASDLVAVRTKW